MHAIDADFIAQRLSGPPPRWDESDIIRVRPPASELKLRPAAVLVPVMNRPEGLTLLFTLRTSHLPAHAGQISFPGGKMDPEDTDLRATALREAWEEVGIPSDRVAVLGELPNIISPVSGSMVTPVVGLVAPSFVFNRNESEVAEIFEVPLTFLLDPENQQIEERIWQDQRHNSYVYVHNDNRIWGLTAWVLASFLYWLRLPLENAAPDGTIR